MKIFATSWKSSTDPGKQRKYRAKAPLHLKRKLMSVHFSPELQKKHAKRNLPVRVGDKVKVIKGDHKNHEGKVERVDLNRERIYVAGLERSKKDGTKTQFGVRPANLIITELSLDDKERKKALERK